MALVDYVQIAATTHLWPLRSSKCCFESTFSLWFQFISLFAVEWEDEAEAACIGDPFFTLVYPAIDEGSKSTAKGSFNKKKERSLAIDCFMKLFCWKMPVWCTENSWNTGISRCTILLKHLYHILKVLFGLKHSTFEQMDIHFAQHCKRRLSFSRFDDIMHGQPLKIFTRNQFFKIFIELAHSCCHFIP